MKRTDTALTSKLVSQHKDAGEGLDVVALRLENVHLRINGHVILQGIDWKVPAHTCVALIGPNGAGKSSLMNLLSGTLQPTEGRISLLGHSIQGLQPDQVARLGLARSFQIHQLFTQLTVHEHLRMALLVRHKAQHRFWISKQLQHQIDEDVQTWLHRLDLQAQQRLQVSHLSYAHQRLVELGLCLIQDKALLLLDEPTAGLTPEQAAQACQLIQSHTEHRTVLLVEHDMRTVSQLASHIALLHQGQLVLFDQADRVKHHPLTTQVYGGHHPWMD